MGRASTTAVLVAGLLVAVVLAVAVSPFASSSPDGLERVAEDQELAGSARDHDLAESPVADYAVDGVDDERVSTGLAGLLGVLVTFALGAGLFALVRRRRRRDDDVDPASPTTTSA